jgi:hypothetical protein
MERLDEKQLSAVIARKKEVNAVSRAIATDAGQRAEFLADPVAYLRKAGVPLDAKIKFSDRDQEILKLVVDPEIAALYHRGDLAKLAEHLRGNYSGLVNDPSRVAWTVADFHVAIEAVAVAVGVFVAPIRPADDFSEFARLEAIQTARLDAVDARLSAIEAQLRELGRR